MTDRPLLERLDALAKRTGIPQQIAHPPRRRPLRGVAIAALVLGSVGVVTALAVPSATWLGYTILLPGVLLGGFSRIYGPIKPAMSAVEDADEREAQERSRAYLAALTPIIVFTTVALALLPWLAMTQHRRPDDTMFLGLIAATYVLVLWSAVPTLYVSWHRALPDDD